MKTNEELKQWDFYKGKLLKPSFLFAECHEQFMIDYRGMVLNLGSRWDQFLVFIFNGESITVLILERKSTIKKTFRTVGLEETLDAVYYK